MCKFVGVSECVYVCAVCGCAGVNCECVHVLILHLLHTYIYTTRESVEYQHPWVHLLRHLSPAEEGSTN